MSQTLPDVQRAAHAQAIQALIVQVGWCIDHGQLQALTEALHPQVEWVRPDGQVLRGPQAVVAAYAARDPERITRHMHTNVHLQWCSDQEVSAHTTVLLWTGHASDALTPTGRPAQPGQKLGEHRDELVFEQGRWWLRRRQSSFVLYC